MRGKASCLPIPLLPLGEERRGSGTGAGSPSVPRSLDKNTEPVLGAGRRGEQGGHGQGDRLSLPGQPRGREEARQQKPGSVGLEQNLLALGADRLPRMSLHWFCACSEPCPRRCGRASIEEKINQAKKATLSCHSIASHSLSRVSTSSWLLT